MPISVCVIGASGLVGRELVTQLREDADVEMVHLMLRRRIDEFDFNPKIVQHVIDFELMDEVDWPQCEVMCCCLGTTIRVAGSQQAFRRVDLDYVMQSAKKARDAGARWLLVVSAMGADQYSSIFYNRVKGEMESAVETLDYEVAVIFRPSLLSGNRIELRPAEYLSIPVLKFFSLLLPKKYRVIPAHAVARTMVLSMQKDLCGVVVIESDEMQKNK